jgi:hypothetical protein
MGASAAGRRGGWVTQAQAQHNAAMSALNRSLPQFQIPIGNSKYTAPGYLFLGEYYYSYQDVMYPWDPAVIRAIREFEPTAMPITVRSIWQKADYGNLGEPFVLVRHGIARVVRDALLPTHKFRCELPVQPHDDVHALPHVLAQNPANWVEVNHYDRDDRPHGLDLPGRYLPCDWALYHQLRDSYENNRRWQDIAEDFINPRTAIREARAAQKADQGAYVERDIAQMEARREPLSDVEAKAAMLGTLETPHRPFVAVAGSPSPAPSAAGVPGSL